jgi:hypothetical protein
MDLDKVIRYFGSVPNVAKALGLTKWAIYQWRERGIPDSWQRVLRMMMKGR